MADQLLLSFYGDDFTGSTDALESLSRAGARAVLFMEPPTPEQLAAYPGLQAVGVAGMTRSMAPEAMETVLRPAFTALKNLGAAHVHYKVCSTFDSSPRVGSIGQVMDVAAEIFRSRFVPLLVGAPALGRHCVFGNLFARFGAGDEMFRLDRHPSMSKHPVTPSDESDLRLHLGKQTRKRIGLFDILKIELPVDHARSALESMLADGAEVVLFDLLYESQLAVIGGLIDGYASPKLPLFSVGSSGVEMALGAHWRQEHKLSPKAQWADPGRAEPLLVLSGSCSPVTDAQIAWALSNGFTEVSLDTQGIASGLNVEEAAKRWSEQVVEQLKSSRGVVVHTSRGSADARIRTTSDALARRGLSNFTSAALLGSVLGGIARASLTQIGQRRLVVAGGDTSGPVARELGIDALEMIAPLAPGAPLCRIFAPGSPADGLEIVFKGGQVGAPDFFETVAKGKPNS